MTNIVKRISAIAMAFTLLGAGSVVAKTVSPTSDTTITASAANLKGAYKATTNFAYPVYFSSGGSLSGPAVDGGGFVLNYTIHRGTVLVLDSNGICTSGYDYESGMNFKGADFSSFIGRTLVKMY